MDKELDKALQQIRKQVTGMFYTEWEDSALILSLPLRDAKSGKTLPYRAVFEDVSDCVAPDWEKWRGGKLILIDITPQSTGDYRASLQSEFNGVP